MFLNPQTLKFLICNRKTDAHGNIKVAVNDVLYNDCVCYESKRCYTISDSFCADRMAWNTNSFQALLQKLRKATVSCVMSACSSARLCVRMEPLVSHRTVFRETWYMGIFRKSICKIKVWQTFDKYNGCFTWRSVYSTTVLRLIIFRIRIFHTKFAGKIKTQVFCPITFPKILPFMR